MPVSKLIASCRVFKWRVYKVCRTMMVTEVNSRVIHLCIRSSIWEMFSPYHVPKLHWALSNLQCENRLGPWFCGASSDGDSHLLCHRRGFKREMICCVLSRVLSLAVTKPFTDSRKGVEWKGSWLVLLTEIMESIFIVICLSCLTWKSYIK